MWIGALASWLLIYAYFIRKKENSQTIVEYSEEEYDDQYYEKNLRLFGSEPIGAGRFPLGSYGRPLESCHTGGDDLFSTDNH